MWLVPLAESTAACGGKARGLARLIAAGLPVPEGWVLDDRAFRAAAGELRIAGPDEIGHALAEAAARIEAAELPPALVAEVAARAAELGRLAVRSSATIEDGEAGAAAGVFSSQVAVAPADVLPAVRAVWSSALTPLAVRYARLRDGAAIAIAAILQRYVAGERVTIYTRPPGAPARDELWIQRGGRIEERRRGEPDPLVELALRAERAIEAARGADVELVIAGEPGPARVWIVQARPIVHPAPRAQVPPPPVLLAPLVADGRRWTWDAAHNPDPLSVAQAELVERVERAGVAPWSMRVCGGYLYTAPREELPRPALASRAALEDRVRALEARIEAALGDGAGDGDGGGDGAGDLSIEAALARYLAFYAIWAREVVPLIAAARARAPSASLRGARPSAIEAALLAAARGELAEDAVIARFAAMAPAWDVAVPTFGERPAALRDAIARARLLELPGADPGPLRSAAPPPPPPTPDEDLARAGADLAERDDLWFARAQWLVRRALLSRAAALGLPPEDACWLPLDELGAGAPAPDLDDARRRAGAARAAAARAARWSMPFAVGGPPAGGAAGAGPSAEEPGPGAAPGGALRGIGAGGRATGRVKRVSSLAGSIAVGRGDVVVARAVTPALAVFVTGCAALVSETGGALDHGASLARELGIACVVGCRDALARLDDGMIVTVDGSAGFVVVDEG
jgi:phosphohistidine swiveling domain-containing protein